MSDVTETDWTDARPRFADDVSLFVLEDTGVVFSESAQEIYQLNTTATFIWCQFDEGLSPSEAARELAQTFDVSLEDAQSHVREAMVCWKKHGFLADGQATKPFLGEVFPSPKPLPDGTLAAPGVAEAATRSYRVFHHLYQAHFGTPEIEAWVHPVLSHLECPEVSPVEGAVQVIAVEAPGRFVIARQGGPAYWCSKPDEIAPLVKWAIFLDVLEEADQALALHAGAVSQGDRALIFPGQAGSGKTTLTAALVHAGFNYLSDDLILLEQDLATVQGIPFSLSVKEEGVDLLSGRFPVLKDLRTHKRVDGKRLRYLSVRQSDPSPQPRIAWIVFPSYDPEGANRLMPMRAARALQQLAKSCSLVRPISKQQAGDLVSLLGRVDCYECRVASLDEAVPALADLFGQGDF